MWTDELLLFYEALLYSIIENERENEKVKRHVLFTFIKYIRKINHDVTY